MDGPKHSSSPTIFHRTGSARSTKRVRLALDLVIVIYLLYMLARSFANLGSGLGVRNRAYDVYNRTLGFERVFAIGLPERTDKRDTVTLAASFTDFDFEWIPGVPFEDISKKAVPPTWNYTMQTNGALGCWRAHMNVMQRVVAERLSSVIIIEDDADWSVNLKDQLLEFALGAQALEGSTGLTHSPYGGTWDFLWIGHCRIGPPDEATRLWVVPGDATVPPIPKRHAKWRQTHIPPEILTNDTRMIFNVYGGSCTQGTAVSFQGARKILQALSLTSVNNPIDLAYRDLCGGKLLKPFNCVGVYPPLMGTHRAAGPENRDSDLNDRSSRFHEEYTWDIPFSTIQNIPRLLQGESSVLSQPGFGTPGVVPIREMRIDEPYVVKGELRTFDFRAMEREQVEHINI